MNRIFVNSIAASLLAAALGNNLGTAVALNAGNHNKAIAEVNPNGIDSSQPSESTKIYFDPTAASFYITQSKSKPLTTKTEFFTAGTKGNANRGIASWYGPGFHGRLTANGERYNQNGLTAAHRSLPFGTKVRVTNMNNGRSVVVRINDRGPFVGGRIIDLSAGAARVIGIINSGVAPVQIEILGR